jgi:hypothetical protein
MQGGGCADDLLYFKCPTTKQMRFLVNAYESFWNCRNQYNKKRCDSESEVKYFCLSSEVNEMGTTVQYHVGEEFILVNLTSFCTGNSDAYWDFIFD